MAEIMEVEEIGEIEAVEQEPELQSQAEVNQTQEDDDLPEKYRGKSSKEIAKMHMEAESAFGRQSNDLGELRKLTDELLRQQIKQPETEKHEVDFFENPQEHIRNAVENNPKVLAAERMAQQLAQQSAKQSLVAKHPDMAEIVRNEDFANWVKASPVRTRLFQAADAYDVEAADELLSTYKQLKTVRATQDVEADKANRSASIKSASVDTGGSGEKGKKIFRRADLIRLKMNDPQKYEAMQDTIDAAYREGRIK